MPLMGFGENHPKHFPNQSDLVPTNSTPSLSFCKSPISQSPWESTDILPGRGGRSAERNGVVLYSCQLRMQEILAWKFGMRSWRWGGSCGCSLTGEFWGGKNSNKRHLLGAKEVTQKISGNTCELQNDHCFTSPLQISCKSISCGHSNGTRAGEGPLGKAAHPHQVDTIKPPCQASCFHGPAVTSYRPSPNIQPTLSIDTIDFKQGWCYW